jgi:hypothetical protein
MSVPSQEGKRCVILCLGFRYCLFIRLSYWILELFLQGDILELFLQGGILELFLQGDILELFLQGDILELFLQGDIFCFLFYYWF